GPGLAPARSPGARPDAPVLDAPAPDSPVRDAPALDVPAPDALTPDAPVLGALTEPLIGPAWPKPDAPDAGLPRQVTSWATCEPVWPCPFPGALCVVCAPPTVLVPGPACCLC